MSNNGPPIVLWLIAAQQQLLAALAKELADCYLKPNVRLVEEKQQHLNGILQRTFAGASTIVVRERLQGFRKKPELHILWVEVFPDPCKVPCDPESRIVKIHEEPEILKQEWDAWQACRPPGMHADTIMTMLSIGASEQEPAGSPTEGPNRNRILSLLYGEGHAVLASGDALDLEEAFIECCRFGTPTLLSAQHAIQRIFSQLYRRYYHRAFVTCPPETLNASPVLKPRIQAGLLKWRDSLQETAGSPPEAAASSSLGSTLTDAERLRHRRTALRKLATRRESFIDPCDYMQFLIDNPMHAPRILCGCSHGDLHGRNILASPMQDEIGSVCVFDYEDMRPDNAIGWDFVKLETELKIRVYPHLFKGPLDDVFVSQVHDFEEALARLTERVIHDNRDERVKVPGDLPGERLAHLILAIRREAQRYLGVFQDRERDWLEELYFLILCYGCQMAKLPSYGRKELISGYIAAGTAARRLDLPWRRLAPMIEQARDQAAESRNGIVQLDSIETSQCQAKGEAKYDASKTVPQMSYHASLEFAQVWSRSGQGQPQLLHAAAAYLEKLREDYPHALEIEEELVFTYLELNDKPKALRLLDEIDGRYPQGASDEVLTRRGRIAKDAAVEDWKDGQPLPQTAREEFKNALEIYQQAYERSRSYYPAINVASLRYILNGGNGSEDESDLDNAESALKRWQPNEEELVWHDATWAELLFLQGKHEASKERYEHAIKNSHCRPQHKQSMLRQLKLLCRASQNDGDQARGFWTHELLIPLFGADTFAVVYAGR